MGLSAGTRLGPYQIAASIGAGGMGEVYRARDTRLGRDVAIKVIPADLAREPERIKRFEQEARAAGAMSHPNVCAIYDVGTHGGSPFVVMELLEGETLREKLASGPIPLRKALDYAAQAAEGLAAAHEKGIVHRDLKPANVFVTRDGRVKVLDFGLAKLTRPEVLASSGETAPSVTATETGVLLGTVGYMSPEQVRGLPVDHRSDLFSLGAILYELLTGKRAFSGPTYVETLNAILNEDPALVAAGGSGRGIPAALELIVRRCLEKNPAERFESAKDLAFGLASLSSEGTAGGRSPQGGRLKRWLRPALPDAARRRSLAIAGLAAAVLCAAVFLLYNGLLTNRPRQSRESLVIRSLAVLPFENISRDPKQDYLAAGMTDELTSLLGRIGGLRVISRSSSAASFGSGKPLTEIARSLGVDAMVEGSVLQQADRLRINVTLVNASPERQIWGESYEVQMGDVLSMQAQVARAVVQSAGLVLTPEQSQRILRSDVVDPVAFTSTLKGRVYLFEHKGKADLERARQLFEEAIRADSAYAPAWAGIADSWYFQSTVFTPPKDAMPRARHAAEKAIHLDEESVEGHAVLGAVSAFYEWDWTRGEREFTRALEINPSYSLAHFYYASLLSATGRQREAIVQIDRARALEPQSGYLARVRGTYLFRDGAIDSAAAQYRQAGTMDPQDHLALLQAATMDALQGRHQTAVKLGERAAAMSHGVRPEATHYNLVRIYALSHKMREARVEAESLIADVRRHHTGTTLVGSALATIGEEEAALGWMEKACDARDEDLTVIGVDPMMKPLYPNPRFRRLIERMNLVGFLHASLWPHAPAANATQ